MFSSSSKPIIFQDIAENVHDFLQLLSKKNMQLTVFGRKAKQNCLFQLFLYLKTREDKTFSNARRGKRNR